MYHNMQLVRDIIWEKEEHTDYGRLYFCSNEPLELLFNNFSVEGKDVLTVLGSSDQLFHTIDRGANTVDTFDRNPYTKYYYYLRRWNILYNQKYYITDDFFRTHFPIVELLCRVECQSEEEEDAYSFWRKYINTIFPFENYDFFYHCSRRNYVDHMETFKDKLASFHPTFYLMDIYKENNIPKQYDIIITSNMFEYVRRKPYKIELGRDHLKSLLKDNGKIIASHMVHGKGDPYFEKEVEIYSNDFTYEEFPWYENPVFHYEHPVGYSYTKKMSTKNS